MSTATEPRCGRCGHPESAHRSDSRDPAAAEVLLALLGCKGYAVSRAAVAQARATTHSCTFCRRCLQRGHETEDCPC